MSKSTSKKDKSKSKIEEEENKENILTEEIKKEIKEQLEYYLGDENLKKDAFFHQLISSSPDGYLDLKYILKCNKIKKKGWSKDDLKKGVELSDFIELDKTGEKIRRKNNLKLPELTLLNQKRKKSDIKEKDKKEDKINDDTNNKEIKKEEAELPAPTPILKLEERKDIIIFKINCEGKTESSWKKIFEEFKKLNPELNVDYGRFKDNEGHISIILKKEQNLENLKFTQNFEIGKEKFNVEKCEGENLSKFWKDHGSHYEYCLTQREKHNKTKENRLKNKKKYLDEKITLGGKEYCNIDLIKNQTKQILNNYKDGEKLSNEDKNFVLDLLKYHHNYEEKIKNMETIIVDKNEKFTYSRCFFIVDKNGKKTDFSSKKCIENIMDKLKQNEK